MKTLGCIILVCAALGIGWSLGGNSQGQPLPMTQPRKAPQGRAMGLTSRLDSASLPPVIEPTIEARTADAMQLVREARRELQRMGRKVHDTADRLEVVFPPAPQIGMNLRQHLEQLGLSEGVARRMMKNAGLNEDDLKFGRQIVVSSLAGSEACVLSDLVVGRPARTLILGGDDQSGDGLAWPDEYVDLLAGMSAQPLNTSPQSPRPPHTPQ